METLVRNLETFHFHRLYYFQSMYAPKITMLGRPPVFIRNMETFVRNFIWESGILRILDLSFEKCVLDLTFVVNTG